MKFYNHTLANGLTIIGEQRETAASVAIGFFVGTGSRDESPEIAGEISGVSHFLEHMMFKGTANRSALDVTYQLGAIGAQANAFTSEENTVYYMAILPEYFNDALELLSDMMRPSLVAEEFDTEKKVILEEIALYQDRPTHVLFERSMREFFNGHPAGNSVLGTTDTVGGLTRDQMQAYFDVRYTAPNIILAASGNFDWQELIDRAEQYCGNWPGETVSRSNPEFDAATTETVLTKENLQCAHVCLLTTGPSAQDEERYAANILSCILGDSSGSRAYWDLVDKGLADVASIDLDEMDGTGLIYGYASGKPENIETIESVLSAVMSSPLDFKEEDLLRAKTKIGTRLVLQGESVMRRLMAIGLDWRYRKNYTTLEDELKRTKAVSTDEIKSMLEQYSFAPATKLRLMPA